MSSSISKQKDSGCDAFAIQRPENLQVVPDCDIGFVELNSDQQTSVVLLHGALSSPLDFGLVVPYLQNYHILIPAIHSNPRRKAPRPPFTIAGLCSQLATIVHTKAKRAEVHVLGFSMGAYIALDFAMLHPELVLKLVISGISLSSQSSWWKRAALPSVLYSQSLLPKYLLSKQKHIQVLNWAMRPASQNFMSEYIEQQPEADWSLCKEIAEELSHALPENKPISIKPRTLVIAATASPGDSTDAARTIVKEIRKSGGMARGIEVKDGSHPWLLQLPELCANIFKTWIEDGEVPPNVIDIEQQG